MPRFKLRLNFYKLFCVCSGTLLEKCVYLNEGPCSQQACQVLMIPVFHTQLLPWPEFLSYTWKDDCYDYTW